MAARMEGQEVATVDVFVLGVKLATVRIALTLADCDPAAAEGHIVMRSRVESTWMAVAPLLRGGYAELESVLDGRTGLPRENASHYEVEASPRDYTVQFREGAYSYDMRRSDGFALSESIQVPEGVRPHDAHSSVLLLRTLRPVPGERVHGFGVVGRHLYRMDVTCRGNDVVATGQAAPRSAILFEGVAEKLTGTDRAARGFRLWLSDDAAHVPLRALIESKWGEIDLQTVGYGRSAPERDCRRALAGRPRSSDVHK